MGADASRHPGSLSCSVQKGGLQEPLSTSSASVVVLSSVLRSTNGSRLEHFGDPLPFLVSCYQEKEGGGQNLGPGSPSR
jgi:hypothetical protein